MTEGWKYTGARRFWYLDSIPTVASLSRVSVVCYQARRLAVLEVHLLSFVKSDASLDNGVGSSAKYTLVLFTYLALFFCLGAVVSGHILTYWSVELPVRPPRERGLIQEGFPDGRILDPLHGHSAKRTWVRGCVMWHCECPVLTIRPCPPSSPRITGLFSLIAGTVSLITQVLLYVWLEESNSVRIIISIITVFVVLPLVSLIPFLSGNSKRHG